MENRDRIPVIRHIPPTPEELERKRLRAAMEKMLIQALSGRSRRRPPRS
ncbi:MAG TPA: hypothetical protein VFF73_14830 [Planctomycetota bacterium]|nr:hypothetical protein [Planctomycetota bacterium]